MREYRPPHVDEDIIQASLGQINNILRNRPIVPKELGRVLLYHLIFPHDIVPDDPELIEPRSQIKRALINDALKAGWLDPTFQFKDYDNMCLAALCAAQQEEELALRFLAGKHSEILGQMDGLGRGILNYVASNNQTKLWQKLKPHVKPHHLLQKVPGILSPIHDAARCGNEDMLREMVELLPTGADWFRLIPAPTRSSEEAPLSDISEFVSIVQDEDLAAGILKLATETIPDLKERLQESHSEA